MRRRPMVAMGLCLGLLVSVCVVSPLGAQKKDGKAAAAKEARIDGTIHMIDKATKTVTVRLRGKPMQREVVYSDSTKFTFRNKTATLDEVKEGRRVICLGTYNDKKQLVASRIDVRDTM